MTKILIKKEDGKGLIGCYEGSKDSLRDMLSELLSGDDDFFALTGAAYNQSVKIRSKSN